MPTEVTLSSSTSAAVIATVAVSVSVSSSSPPVASMNASQVQRELRSYAPLTAAEVRSDPEFLERQSQIWRRLDHLVAAWERYKKEKR